MQKLLYRAFLYGRREGIVRNIEVCSSVIYYMNFGFVQIYIRLIRTIFAKYKLRMLVLTFLGFLNSSFDAIGIGIIIPLFSIFMDDANASTNFITRSTVWLFSLVHVKFDLYSILAFMIILLVAKAVGEFLVMYIRVRVTTDFERDLRLDLYGRTLSSRWSYLINQKAGYLDSVIMGDVSTTQTLLKQLCATIPNMASTGVYLLFAMKISYSTTVAAMICGGFLLLIFRPMIVRVKRYSDRQTTLKKVIAHRVNENVGGMKALKAMGVEKKVLERERTAFEKLRHLTVKSSFVQQMGASVIDPFTFLFIAVILAYSYGQPQFSLANFAVVMFLVQRIFNSVRKTQNSWNNMAIALPQVEHVLKFDDEIRKEQEIDEVKEAFVFEKEIEFRDVSFAYGESEHVLSGFSLKIKKNEMVGIIGPSGAGKTTIVDLMLRFFAPTKGRVLVDGIDMNDLSLKDQRSHIGYMSQDVFLINGTVEDNIKFFRDISDEDMIRAAKLANAYDFIEALPEKFDALIGERGLLLSGGQRQRIVLARILAARPDIIILDEATSALDTESELMIKKSLEELRKDVTIIIIAHRLSTIMGVDHLVALEKGRLVEEGNPVKLLEDQNSYFSKVKSLVESGETSEILR